LVKAIRTSFGLLHDQFQREQQARRDKTERRIELIAALLLIPTFVVGLFGANTWLPGDRRPPGDLSAFFIMLAAIATFTVAGVVFIRTMQREQRREERTLREQARLRESVFDHSGGDWDALIRGSGSDT
jgi:CorA-like Mg2+ transporter protein